MFDAWKKAWVQRNKDGTVDDHPEDGMAPGASIDPVGHETSGPGEGLPVDAPFVPHDSQNARSLGETISSAPNPIDGTDSSLDDSKTDVSRSSSDERSENPRPSKRRKVAPEESVVSPAQATIEASDLDNAFEAIKHNNVIVTFDPPTPMSNFIRKVWTAFTQEESRRFERGEDKRVAVFASSDIELVEEQYAALKNTPFVHVTQCIGPTSDTEIKGDILPDLATTDAIVLSATLLLELLKRDLFAISNINLLVLDRVNLAQGGHPLAQIMLEHYHAADSSSRPRVLGLMDISVAQEVDLLSIESTVDASVSGLSPEIRNTLMSNASKPVEIVTFYESSGLKRETTLCGQLHGADPDGKVIKKQFAGAAATLRDVGPCAADLVWRRYMISTEAEFKALELDLTGDDAADEAAAEILSIRSKIRTLLKNWTFTMPNLNPSSKSFNVTPKFAKLVQILQCFEYQGDHFRGIVFVHKRSTAAAIADMLRTLGDELSFLRPQPLCGPDRVNPGAGTDFSAQQDIVEEFRSGKTNLLISTRFGEDGIELPSATCVIRFDLFPNHISYAQSRARTDQRNGHFIIMVEQGNDVHRRLIHGIARLDPLMQQWVHAVANSHSGVVPPQSLLEKTNAERVESDDEDPIEEFILDPTTGGRIYLKDATGVVYKYIADGNAKGPTSKPLFEYVSLPDRKCVCTVSLFPHSPLPKVTGPPAQTKGEARRQACYETCYKLFKMGYLEHTYFPRPSTMRSFLPDIYANFSGEPDYEARGSKPSKVHNPAASLSLDANGRPIKGKTAGTRCYVRKRPAFWKNTVLTGGMDQLFPTVINIDLADHTEEKYRTMCFLTRHPLPPIEPFKLFFSGFPAMVHLRRCAPIDVTEDQFSTLHKYTVRICRTISGKAVECELQRTPYFFAPMKANWKCPEEPTVAGSARPDVRDGISWDDIVAGSGHWLRSLRTKTKEGLEADLEDAIIQDRLIEFTRRYDVIRLRTDLSPLSKLQGEERESEFENFIEFCKAKRKGFEGLRDEHQPMIEVTAVTQLVNRLNPAYNMSSSPRKRVSQFLIPELCARFVISSSIFRTSHLLPSIIRRIDDFCLVKEVNAKLFDNWLNESTLLVALCAPSASVEFDYERLELLGDAYLKYLSSIYLFVTYPTQQEGAMHVARQKIISNRSLLQNAREADVPQYIQSKPFTPRAWIPYNFKVARFIPRAKSSEPDNGGGSDTAAIPQVFMEIDEQEPGTMSNCVPPVSAIPPRQASIPTLEEGEMEDVPPEEPAQPSFTEVLGSDGVKAEEPDSSSPSKQVRKRWEDVRVQWLGDKCVADVAEAIIGAACKSGGIEAALKIAKDLGCYLPRVDRWSDFGRKALAPPPESTAELSEENVAAIEKIVGCKIKRPHILAQALTHTSIQGNELPCYERLEFLGDAVLDYLVIGHIFDLYGQLSPGALTLLKGAMVTNTALATICVETELYKYIIHDSQTLQTSIDEYVRELKKARNMEYQLAESEGRMPGQYWVDVEPPKALSDVVESILGAILVSDNFVADGTQTMYDLLLKPFYEKHISLRTLSHHPTKILFELFQSRGCQKFEIVKEDDVEEDGFSGTGMRCDVICHDVILASAIDLTAQLASRRASFLALDALEGDTEFLSRTCDCRALNEASKGSKGSRRRKSNSGTDLNQDPNKYNNKAPNDGHDEAHDGSHYEVDDDGEGDELAVEGVLYDDDDDDDDEEDDGEEDGEGHSEESAAERE